MCVICLPKCPHGVHSIHIMSEYKASVWGGMTDCKQLKFQLGLWLRLTNRPQPCNVKCSGSVINITYICSAIPPLGRGGDHTPRTEKLTQEPWYMPASLAKFSVQSLPCPLELSVAKYAEIYLIFNLYCISFYLLSNDTACCAFSSCLSCWNLVHNIGNNTCSDCVCPYVYSNVSLTWMSFHTDHMNECFFQHALYCVLSDIFPTWMF